MVLILDFARNMFRTYVVKLKKIHLDDYADLNKCLELIKSPVLAHTRAKRVLSCNILSFLSLYQPLKETPHGTYNGR